MVSLKLAHTDARRTKDGSAQTLPPNIDLKATNPENGDTLGDNVAFTQEFQGFNNGERGSVHDTALNSQ